MNSNEIKIACLVFMILLASRALVPDKLHSRFPWIRSSMGVLAYITITIAALFTLK